MLQKALYCLENVEMEESVHRCWSLSPVRRQTVGGESENSGTNKGILSAPEAACAATSTAHSRTLFLTALLLRGFVTFRYLLGRSKGLRFLISCCESTFQWPDSFF